MNDYQAMSTSELRERYATQREILKGMDRIRESEWTIPRDRDAIIQRLESFDERKALGKSSFADATRR